MKCGALLLVPEAPELELDEVVELDEAALAIAPPPSAAAMTAAPVTSIDLMFLMSLLLLD